MFNLLLLFYGIELNAESKYVLKVVGISIIIS